MRLYNLTAKSLWYDEASSIVDGLRSFNFISQPTGNYKLVYAYLLKVWLEIFGVSALAARLLSVIFGIGSIFLIFLIGKSLFNKGIGLISSFLLAVSCFHIYHSQQVKYIAFLLFLALSSLSCFIEFIRKNKIRFLMINSMLNILIIYTHPFGFSIILVQFLYVFFSYHSMDKKELKKWCLLQLPLLFVSLLWAVLIISEKKHLRTILWWAQLPSIHSLTETFKTFCYGGPRYGINDDANIQTCPVDVARLLIFIFGALFTRGMLHISKYRSKINESLLILWLLLPIVLGFLFSYLFYHIYFIKLFLISLPAFYLIVAIGIYHGNKLYHMLGILLLISWLNVSPLKAMYKNDTHVDWQKTAFIMKQQHISDDATIIISTCKEVVPFMYYLSNADKADLKDIGMFGKFTSGHWQDSFRYKNHQIIAIANELGQKEDAYYALDKSGITNKTYDFNYILADFDRKVMQKDVLDTNKEVWLLVSRWTGEEYNRQAMVEKLNKYLKMAFKEETGGVRIYRFEP